MGKGYAKLYRAEADNAGLWENATLFCAYQKLKIVALWPEGIISRPYPVLARQVAMSVNTLRKAVAGLERLGLLESSITARGVLSLKVKYVEQETETNETGPKTSLMPATGVQLLNIDKNAPEADLGPAKEGLENTVPVLPGFETKDFCGSAKNDMPAVQNLHCTSAKFALSPVQNLHCTKYKNILINNNNIIPPYMSPLNLQSNGFADFWDAYPNKKGKQRAIQKWKSLNCDAELILPVLEKQKRLRDWVKQEGQFVPHADAYLNQKRWEDHLPQGEEAYILDFKQPTTERERVLFRWLDATNPALLSNDNQKINSVFEPDRALFEQIVSKCGGNLQMAFEVMRHGWRTGCSTMRAICERTAVYLDELREVNK